MRRILSLLTAFATLSLLPSCSENNIGTCLEYNPVTGVCVKKGDPTPTPTPDPGMCPFVLSCGPQFTSGGARTGFYTCETVPPGPTSYNVAGRLVSAEYGILVEGFPGDVAGACRGCGCAQNVTLR